MLNAHVLIGRTTLIDAVVLQRQRVCGELEEAVEQEARRLYPWDIALWRCITDPRELLLAKISLAYFPCFI